MSGFNKGPNDQAPAQNLMQPGGQQNQPSQGFMGTLPNNPLMNFGMQGPQIPQMGSGFEGTENFNYGSMGQVTERLRLVF